MSKDYSNLEGLMSNVKESIRNSYDKGYKQGFNEGQAHQLAADDIFRESCEKSAYEKGLNDAWECARKILFDDNLPSRILEELKVQTWTGIIENYSVSEAIAKIKKYEEKQKQADDEIKVGDEVYIIMENYPSVVTCVFSESGLDNLKAVHITGNGKYAVTPLSQLHKTGRHFDQIAEVLEQLKE